VVVASSDWEDRGGGGGRARAAILSGGVAFAACLTVLLATPADTFWINDCGNKALVAQRLLETGYRELGFDHPAAPVDPAARAFPIAPPFATAWEKGFVSVYPPAYAALAAPFLAVFGPVGLRLPAALAVAACAGLLTLWLAAAVGSARAFGAGAALALATPLFFYGITVWEHSLTVALGLGAWMLAARYAPVRLFWAGWLVASACWLREELALMGIALALAALVQWRRPAAVLWLAAGALLPVAGLLALNEFVYGTPLGVHLAAASGSGAAASGMPEAASIGSARVFAGLLAGFGKGEVEPALLGALALAAPLVGWVAARCGRAPSLVLVLVALAGLAAWLLGAARTFASVRPLGELVRYNGLLVQMPMFCLAGIGFQRVFRRPEWEAIRVGVLAGALFLAFAVAAGMASGSGYGVQTGFGVHWGPRALLPAIPAVVALAVAALPSDAAPPSARLAIAVRVACASLVAAGLLSSAHAARMLADQKADARSFQAAVRAQAPRYVVTTHPLLAQHVSGLWDEKPMLLARDPRALRSAVVGLRAGGAREFLLVVPAGAALLAGIDGLDCRLANRHRGPRLHYFDLDIQRCRIAGHGRRQRSGRTLSPGRESRARSR
jgi:hypothetical protein